jgi:hypothetical protein
VLILHVVSRATLILGVVIGIPLIVIGFIALLFERPFHVWFGFFQSGGIIIFSFGLTYFILKDRIKNMKS